MIAKYQYSSTNRKFDETEVNNVVNFFLNGITTLHLLKLNKSPHKLMLGYANTLIKTVDIC